MNARGDTRVKYRAAFGVGFVVLGAITFYRMVAAPAPLSTKLLGLALGAAMLALGIARIAAFLAWRRENAR